MLTTFNFRAQPGKEPLYRQLADYFRQEIRQQHLVSQDFLPSIRKLTRDLKLSRTTVENAYQILIDQGYVENLPNRGYRVAVYQPREASEGQEAGEELRRPEVRWNFSNNYIDTSTFDTVLWRRCLNQVLRNPASIAGYGDPQGEPELRRVLARYSYASRGVVCRPEQILVGAGLQTLLLILLPLLPLDQKVAGLEAPGFPQAEQIFHLMGWKTRLFDPADPKGDWPGLLMISPANPYKGAGSDGKRTEQPDRGYPAGTGVFAGRRLQRGIPVSPPAHPGSPQFWKPGTDHLSGVFFPDHAAVPADQLSGAAGETADGL